MIARLLKPQYQQASFRVRCQDRNRNFDGLAPSTKTNADHVGTPWPQSNAYRNDLSRIGISPSTTFRSPSSTSTDSAFAASAPVMTTAPSDGTKAASDCRGRPPK